VVGQDCGNVSASKGDANRFIGLLNGSLAVLSSADAAVTKERTIRQTGSVLNMWHYKPTLISFPLSSATVQFGISPPLIRVSLGLPVRIGEEDSSLLSSSLERKKEDPKGGR